ncbi:hypothetical protein [Thermoactinomyces sp. CICC 10521]|uniref:hypothetical protein n=1 Tax=Thermoactinomyces sp. CICC 10521 TaxID=2767426 RepID=UPI0018DC6412|nr:hypothetical protein [Thermoactinomyces sp. CICC 10521]MBH8609103.1 hypothetical protein [Thermoactinomyces sp. CICC 10521]
MTSMRDLKRDLEIIAKATPGKWFDYARYGNSIIFGHEIRLENEDGPVLAEDVSATDAHFIVEAREAGRKQSAGRWQQRRSWSGYGQKFNGTLIY